jgi:hypothetical protein
MHRKGNDVCKQSLMNIYNYGLVEMLKIRWKQGVAHAGLRCGSKLDEPGRLLKALSRPTRP